MKVLGAILLAVTLGGCSTLQAIVAGNSVAQSAPQTVADAEKALTIAHLAYNGVGTALIAATNSGALKGANAAQAKGFYDQAGDALAAADQADAAANVQGVVNQVNAAEALIQQINTMVK